MRHYNQRSIGLNGTNHADRMPIWKPLLTIEKFGKNGMMKAEAEQEKPYYYDPEFTIIPSE